MSLFFYSTNPWLKHYVREKFYGGVHFVWCSKSFADAVGAPSSTPQNIYRRLKEDCNGKDKNSLKIAEQRSGLIKRTKSDLRTGVINGVQAKEITVLARDGDFSIWRPLLFIIPVARIDPSRVIEVDVTLRAGIALEYQLGDLHSDEFDWIELP